MPLIYDALFNVRTCNANETAHARTAEVKSGMKNCSGQSEDSNTDCVSVTVDYDKWTVCGYADDNVGCFAFIATLSFATL